DPRTTMGPPRLVARAAPRRYGGRAGTLAHRHGVRRRRGERRPKPGALVDGARPSRRDAGPAATLVAPLFADAFGFGIIARRGHAAARAVLGPAGPLRRGLDRARRDGASNPPGRGLRL